MTARTLTAGLAGLVVAGAIAFAASPALAVSPKEAEKICEDKASKHEPPLSSVDWEAFMADCLADTTTPEKE